VFLTGRVVDHLRHRPERVVLFERARAARQDLRPLPEARDELIGESALADTRLTEERDEVRPFAAGGPFEDVVQQSELTPAIDQRDPSAVRLRTSAELEDGPRDQIVLEPFRSDLT
jgi:hypothetical protein